MDSIVIKVVNIPQYKNDDDEEPSSFKLLYLPTTIHSHTVEEIHPKVADNGRLYKNISTLRTDKDQMYDIVGNYKKENKRIFSNRNTIGY